MSLILLEDGTGQPDTRAETPALEDCQGGPGAAEASRLRLRADLAKVKINGLSVAPGLLAINLLSVSQLQH